MEEKQQQYQRQYEELLHLQKEGRYKRLPFKLQDVNLLLLGSIRPEELVQLYIDMASKSMNPGKSNESNSSRSDLFTRNNSSSSNLLGNYVPIVSNFTNVNSKNNSSSYHEYESDEDSALTSSTKQSATADARRPSLRRGSFRSPSSVKSNGIRQPTAPSLTESPSGKRPAFSRKLSFGKH